MKRILSGATALALCLVGTSQSQAAVDAPLTEDALGYKVLTEDIATQTGTVGVSAGSKGISGNITIPELVIIEGITYTVTTIEKDAFNGCSNLSSVSISDSLTSVGERAFLGCSSLTSIEVGLGNTHYSSLEGVLFNKDQSALLQYPGGKKAEEYIIPDSVKSIGAGAFTDCTGLTSIYFEGDAPSVDSDVFSGCMALKTLYYVEGMKGWTNPWQEVPTETWVPEPPAPDGLVQRRVLRDLFNDSKFLFETVVKNVVGQIVTLVSVVVGSLIFWLIRRKKIKGGGH